jgi:hypothetical protein
MSSQACPINMPLLAAHGLLQGDPFSFLESLLLSDSDSFVLSSFHDDITIRPTATHSELWMETPTPCPFPTPSLSIAARGQNPIPTVPLVPILEATVPFSDGTDAAA